MYVYTEQRAHLFTEEGAEMLETVRRTVREALSLAGVNRTYCQRRADRKARGDGPRGRPRLIRED